MTKRPPVVTEAVREKLRLKVEATLGSFKASVDADTVAVFDGWQGTVRLPEGPPSTAHPWDAMRRLPCLAIDWHQLKSELVRNGDAEVVCRCGAHFFTGFLIRRRWSFIVIGRESLVAPTTELLPIRTNALETLARILPELDTSDAPLMPPDDSRGGNGGAAPAELGIPLWWAGRPN
jgi:hypothetical protein